MRRLLSRLSLRTRLVAALIGVLLTALVLGGLYGLQAAREVGGQALQQMAQREAQVLALTLTEALILGDYSAARELMQRAAAQGGFVWARLMDNGQAIAVDSPPADAQRPDWFAALIGLEPAVARQSITVGGRHYGSIELAVAPTVVEDRLWRLLGRLFAVALAASLLLAALMVWIMRVNLEALARIAQAGKGMAEGRPPTGIRLPASAPPELIATAQALDAAHGRIQAQIEQLATEKERWRVTLEAIADAVIVTDADSRVRFMNPAAERLTDWDEVNALDRPIEQIAPLIDETHRQPIAHPVLMVLKGEAPQKTVGQALLRTASGGEI
ncbi:MAG: LapD/MoxY N-terminal periplasmic domain-containing protein, partial [Thiobacillaceae bacterium]